MTTHLVPHQLRCQYLVPVSSLLVGFRAIAGPEAESNSVPHGIFFWNRQKKVPRNRILFRAENNCTKKFRTELFS